MANRTYQVDVEGVGSFQIRRRSMGVNVEIGAEYNRLTEGQDKVSDFFGRFCNVYATLKVLIVSGPSGWDIEELDPDDEESYAKLNKVFAAIMEKETFFRRGVSPAGQGAGPGGVGES